MHSTIILDKFSSVFEEMHSTRAATATLKNPFGIRAKILDQFDFVEKSSVFLFCCLTARAVPRFMSNLITKMRLYIMCNNMQHFGRR